MKNLTLCVLAILCVLPLGCSRGDEETAPPRPAKPAAENVRGKQMKVVGESLVLAETIPGNLCFDSVVKGSVSIRSTFLADKPDKAVYAEGKDYVVDYKKGTIARTKDSSIPDFSKNVAYQKKDFNHNELPGITNHPFFVWVDYETTNGEAFAKPNDQSKYLQGVRKKLEAGGPFRIVSYGDSITAGGEASEPDLRFQARYGKYLQKKFPKAKVEVIDASISGYASQHGIDWFDDPKYMGKVDKADLVLVGWGMNDHNKGGPEPDTYKQNLVVQVNMLRKQKGAEVIIFSCFPPHDDWHYGSHRMHLFAEAAKEAAQEAACAYVDVYSTWEMVLKRKDQSSLLGNNINHPNDFGHWLYEEAFEAMEF